MPIARRLLTAAGGPGGFSPPTPIPDPELDAPDFYQRTLLTTPTYDGSGQATHASVVKIPRGWNGALYWMAMTPYPGADNSYENPSILVSNDGETWTVPTGLTNPVIPERVSGFNSDTELAYYGGTLWMFYRVVDTADSGAEEKVYVVSSDNGVTWSSPTLVLQHDYTVRRTLSPAVVRGSDGTWRMWTTDIVASPNVMHLWTASYPTGAWSGPTAVTASISGRDLWHHSVVLDGNTYRMFQFDAESNATPGAGALRLGSSSDGVTWTIGSAVLSPSGGANWDGVIIYRGAGVFEQSRWRVWYGGVATGDVWRIGYTEVDPLDFP